jgi:tRNA (cytidine/uridine-2'-O-)-methyltransferase
MAPASRLEKPFIRVYSSPKPTQPDNRTKGVENASPQKSTASRGSVSAIVIGCLALFHVVLYQPEIPPNTGNIIRLCANTGSVLHLVHPLGFEVDDKRLRRAGLDYREFAEVQQHASFDAFLDHAAPLRWFGVSTRGATRYDTVDYRPGDALVFGPETRGLPQAMLDALPQDRRIRLPMRPGQRSLNLSNAAAVLLYEAWRQTGFDGGR